MNKDKPKTDLLYKIRNGAWGTAAMLSGMALDLFTPLGEKPMDAEELAYRLEIKSDKLAPLLYAIVLTGLLSVKDGVFSNSPEADTYLVKGRDDFMGDSYQIWTRNLQAALQTPETVRSGIPQAKYDWRNMTVEELWPLYEGMAAPDAVLAKQLCEKFDFSLCGRLLDAGGGSGTLTIALTKLHPQIKATVIDLPSVTPITERFVQELEAAENVEVVSGDLTCDNIEGEFDTAILGSVIQVISREEARKVIMNVGGAVRPGGRLFMFGSGMLKDSRLAPESAVNFNLVFINVYDDGQSYTESEYRKWLGEAGFDELEFRYDEFTIVAYKGKG
jgi:SAM-dependent methyltransferase